MPVKKADPVAEVNKQLQDEVATLKEKIAQLETEIEQLRPKPIEVAEPLVRATPEELARSYRESQQARAKKVGMVKKELEAATAAALKKVDK